MLAAVLYLLYVLLVAQIALGLYSFWDGWEWLRMVRRRLGTHPGFYAPVVAVICPCKGQEPGLEDNLTALTRFDYPNYEIYFSLATSLDPALKVIERVKAASAKPVHIVIAGPPADCGEKVHNLRRAVEELPEKFEVIVFTDSDVRFSRSWLGKLVAPLQDPRVGATTGYRWIIPGAGGSFSGALASAWNASVATLLGRARDTFCWGGATAIRRQTFDDARVLDAWKGAVSDDLALTHALEQAGKPIVFCPECLGVTRQSWTLGGLLEFTHRQVLLARIYAPGRWKLGAAAHLGYSLTMVYTAVALIAAMIAGDPWIHLALIALLIPFLAALKGALRTVAVNELLPEWRSQLNPWSWVWTTLAPVVPFLFAWNFLVSLATRQLRWRGIRYKLVSSGVTQILTR